MLEFIQVEKEEKVGIIVWNRPKKVNAWHKPMSERIARRHSK